MDKIKESQCTLKNEISFSGVGLHTSKPIIVTLKPAPINYGIKFVRVDLPDKPVIDVSLKSCGGFIRGLTLRKEDVSIHTTEMFLAALYLLGIDNLSVEVNDKEIPVMDGSALEFVQIIEKAGIHKQHASKETISINSVIHYQEGRTELMAYPSDILEISSTIFYNHPLIGTQQISFVITPDIFKKEIAPARTFCFDYEIEALKIHASLDKISKSNTIVVNNQQIHAHKGLRFKDEFIRHKILQLLGVLSLLRFPLKCRIIAINPGLTHNVPFVHRIAESIKSCKKNNNTVQGLEIDREYEILDPNYNFDVSVSIAYKNGKPFVKINGTIAEGFSTDEQAFVKFVILAVACAKGKKTDGWLHKEKDLDFDKKDIILDRIRNILKETPVYEIPENIRKLLIRVKEGEKLIRLGVKEVKIYPELVDFKSRFSKELEGCKKKQSSFKEQLKTTVDAPARSALSKNIEDANKYLNNYSALVANNESIIRNCLRKYFGKPLPVVK